MLDNDGRIAVQDEAVVDANRDGSGLAQVVDPLMVSPSSQCTHECYSRTYDIVFVTLDGSDETLWVQSTDLDIDAVDAILDSLASS